MKEVNKKILPCVDPISLTDHLPGENISTNDLSAPADEFLRRLRLQKRV